MASCRISVFASQRKDTKLLDVIVASHEQLIFSTLDFWTYVYQVLKIVKHCKDALPHLVSGALLGLDQKGVLEVTHSFPGMSAATAGGEGLGEVTE